MTTFPGLPPMV